MVDRSLLGLRIRSGPVPVERGRLQFFARTIGESDPVYLDAAHARARGYPDIPALPTFVYSLELETFDWIETARRLSVDIGRLLHGEQSFEYYRPLYAGDSVRFEGEVTDVYSGRGGLLDFFIYASEALGRDGERIARMSRTIVVRRPAQAS